MSELFGGTSSTTAPAQIVQPFKDIFESDAGVRAQEVTLGQIEERIGSVRSLEDLIPDLISFLNFENQAAQERSFGAETQATDIAGTLTNLFAQQQALISSGGQTNFVPQAPQQFGGQASAAPNAPQTPPQQPQAPTAPPGAPPTAAPEAPGAPPAQTTDLGELLRGAFDGSINLTSGQEREIFQALQDDGAFASFNEEEGDSGFREALETRLGGGTQGLTPSLISGLDNLTRNLEGKTSRFAPAAPDGAAAGNVLPPITRPTPQQPLPGDVTAPAPVQSTVAQGPNAPLFAGGREQVNPGQNSTADILRNRSDFGGREPTPQEIADFEKGQASFQANNAQGPVALNQFGGGTNSLDALFSQLSPQAQQQVQQLIASDPQAESKLRDLFSGGAGNAGAPQQGRATTDQLIARQAQFAFDAGSENIRQTNRQGLQDIAEIFAPSRGLRPGDSPVLDRAGRFQQRYKRGLQLLHRLRDVCSGVPLGRGHSPPDDGSQGTLRGRIRPGSGRAAALGGRHSLCTGEQGCAPGQLDK